MKPVLGWSVALGCLLLAAVSQAGGGAGLEALQGEWQIVSIEKDGTKTTLGKDALVITFKGATYQLTSDKGFTKSKSGKVKVTGKARDIELIPDDGPYKGKSLLGIHRIDEDDMRACYALPGKPRPVAYTTVPESGRVVIIYKRKG